VVEEGSGGTGQKKGVTDLSVLDFREWTSIMVHVCFLGEILVALMAQPVELQRSSSASPVQVSCWIFF
jgi:hypothetical protein